VLKDNLLNPLKSNRQPISVKIAFYGILQERRFRLKIKPLLS